MKWKHTQMLQEQERSAARARASPGNGSRQARNKAAQPSPSLLRAIIAAYGWPYFLLGLLKAAGDALNLAGPVLLNLLLRHLAATPGGESGGTLSLLGWSPDVAAPLFGYACAASLAASMLLKVSGLEGRGGRSQQQPEPHIPSLSTTASISGLTSPVQLACRPSWARIMATASH
jgi:hypothetical protein